MDKRGFANYFTALITSEKYPDVDNSFAFLDYASASYSVDRTEGANAIKQPLANLKDAGSYMAISFITKLQL